MGLLRYVQPLQTATDARVTATVAIARPAPGRLQRPEWHRTCPTNSAAPRPIVTPIGAANPRTLRKWGDQPSVATSGGIMKTTKLSRIREWLGSRRFRHSRQTPSAASATSGSGRGGGKAPSGGAVPTPPNAA